MGISGTQKALMYALGGVMRGGASRGGYISGGTFLMLNGTHLAFGNAFGPGASIGTLLDSLTITDSLDEVPNRCTFRIKGSTFISTGWEVIITLGSKNNGERLFAGHVLDTRQIYVGTPANVQVEVSCVDYSWMLGFVLVTARYTNQSASTIVADLVMRYAAGNGFTAANVAPNLPTVEEMTFTNEDLPTCLTRLARHVGVYWYVDYRKDVHFYATEIGNGAPVDLTPTHRSLADFVLNRDRSQCLTRVYVEGRGSRVLSAVIPTFRSLGDADVVETTIPLETVDMFAVGPDVFAKVAAQGSEGGSQQLTFTGVVPGGQGATIGPGVTVSNALTAVVAAGSGIEVGVHGYAYTWVTASGETRPSPVRSVTHTAAPTGNTTATTVVNDTETTVNELTSGAWRIGDTVQWAYSYGQFATVSAGTPISPLVSIVAVKSKYYYNTPGQSPAGMRVTIIYSPDPNVKYVYLWHRVNGGAWRVWATGPAGQQYGYTNYPGGTSSNAYVQDNPVTYSMLATPPVAATAAQRTALSGIAIGPTGVTSRKIYRTVAAGSALKLQQTIANNTATVGVEDATPDASLGAAAPTSDTSALPQPTGQVLPYATSIPVSSTAPFEAAGGWAIIGNGEQLVRYTTISTNNLLGMPLDGPGAVVGAVAYGSSITAAPMLTGLPTSGARALARALVAGDELYLVVQRDNLAGQAQLAATLGVGNGVREDWIQDRRLSIPECRARGDATLTLHQLEARGVTYRCRDLRTAAGKLIHVALPAPTNVDGEDYRIQQVTISNFRPHTNQYPTYAVQASFTKFSFEDWLRRMRTKE
jgi:hypothetical protein